MKTPGSLDSLWESKNHFTQLISLPLPSVLQIPPSLFSNTHFYSCRQAASLAWFPFGNCLLLSMRFYWVHPSQSPLSPADTTLRLTNENNLSSWYKNPRRVVQVLSEGLTWVFLLCFDSKLYGSQCLWPPGISCQRESLRIKQSNDKQYWKTERDSDRDSNRDRKLMRLFELPYRAMSETRPTTWSSQLSKPKYFLVCLVVWDFWSLATYSPNQYSGC